MKMTVERFGTQTSSASQRTAPSWASVLMVSLATAAPSSLHSCNAFAAVPKPHRRRQRPSTFSSTTTAPTSPEEPSSHLRLAAHDIADAATLISSVPTAVAHTYNACLAAHKLPTQACTGGIFALLGDGLAQYQTKGDVDPKRSSHFLFKGLVGGVIWATWYSTLDPISEVWAGDIVHAWGGMFGDAAAVASPPPPEASGAFSDAAQVASSSSASFDLSQAEEIWNSEDLMTMSDGAIEFASSAAAADVIEQSVPVEDEQAMRNVKRVTNTIMCVLLEQFIACPIVYSLWDIPVPAALSGTPTKTLPSVVEQKLGPLLVANAKVWTPVNMITYNLPLDFRLLFISMIEIIWQSVNARITAEPERAETELEAAAKATASTRGSKRDSSTREQRISI